MSGLDYDERDVLKTILRYHREHGDEKLEEHLETWGAWIRETEQAKFDHQSHAQFPLVLLSLMGIHGRDALT